MPQKSDDPKLTEAGFMDLVSALKERLKTPDGQKILAGMPEAQRAAAVRLGETAKAYVDVVEGRVSTQAGLSESFSRSELYELNDALHEVVTRMCERGLTDIEIQEQSLAHLWSASKKVTVLLLGDSDTPGIRSFEPAVMAAIAEPKRLKC